MPISAAINDLVPEVRTWRRELHQNPEIMYDVEETAKFVAERLRAFGCDEVKTAVGRTGVVGVIRGAKGSGSSSRSIGLRADMDALPIEEETNLPYRSKTPGKMHACGHDGHTAMLLGAAQRLAATRDFAGNAVVIFQPAEEGGAGAMAMIDDGLLDQFGIEQVYGMHNWPGTPIGAFGLRKGPLMAAADEITITGKGGHGAMPHLCVDPVMVGAQIITALQTITSRNVDPLDSSVISITQFRAGTANNIIPQSAWLNGTVRTLKPATRDMAEKRIHAIATALAAASGATARVEYRRGYPPTINHGAQTDFAASIARKVAGDARVDVNAPPTMGSEDFSFMLEARPGAFIFIGNGDSATLHHPSYDFNDEVLPYGMSYWVELVETALAP
jgi:amidohydrolase